MCQKRLGINYAVMVVRVRNVKFDETSCDHTCIELSCWLQISVQVSNMFVP